jgi:hypothetical protein
MGMLGYASTVYHGLRVMLKAPGILVRWKLGHRRAKNTFKKELIASGISKYEAKDLAELYPFKLEDIISLARSTRS